MESKFYRMNIYLGTVAFRPENLSSFSKIGECVYAMPFFTGAEGESLISSYGEYNVAINSVGAYTDVGLQLSQAFPITYTVEAKQNQQTNYYQTAVMSHYQLTTSLSDLINIESAEIGVSYIIALLPFDISQLDTSDKLKSFALVGSLRRAATGYIVIVPNTGVLRWTKIGETSNTVITGNFGDGVAIHQYSTSSASSRVFRIGQTGIIYENGVVRVVTLSLDGNSYTVTEPYSGDFIRGAALEQSSTIYNQEFYDFLVENSEKKSPDPFSPGGTSEPGGGGGTFDNDSDTIEDSSLPTLSAANTGFTRIYNPSLAQVQALARYLWTDNNLVTTLWNKLKQFVENPMDAFIGFSLLPCAIPNGGSENFSVMFIDTGVQLTVAANQFVDVDCGTLSIEEYYGSALDYSPYTKIDLFLPYIGTQPLDVDEVMGRTLQVKYRIDIVTGGCVAKVLVDGNVLYQYSGHCAMNIPFTSADYTGIVSAIIQAAKVAAAVAAGAGVIGATQEAPAIAPMLSETPSLPTTALANPSDLVERVGISDSLISSANANPAKTAAFAATTAANTVGAVENSKLSVQHSGTFSGNTGYLGVRRPYLIIKRPRMCNPAEYGTFNGYPSMMTLNLGECSGFTKVQQVQLTGLTATNPEKDQIMGLLKMGVIL